MMSIETLWAGPIWFQFFILGHIKLSFRKVTELTINLIAESMYAQCDADGNDYLLIDLLVYYGKDNKMISLTDQQISI